MKKKIILLFLALALPGLIFIFLKWFGKNEFNIPTYYQNADSLNVVCHARYTSPYTIPDSSLTRMGWEGKPVTLIVVEQDQKTMRTIAIVKKELSPAELQLITTETLKLDEAATRAWRNCVFMIAADHNALLVDQQKRIRGYYHLGSLEEADRLEAELKILLKKY